MKKNLQQTTLIYLYCFLRTINKVHYTLYCNFLDQSFAYCFILSKLSQILNKLQYLSIVSR